MRARGTVKVGHRRRTPPAIRCADVDLAARGEVGANRGARPPSPLAGRVSRTEVGCCRLRHLCASRASPTCGRDGWGPAPEERTCAGQRPANPTRQSLTRLPTSPQVGRYGGKAQRRLRLSREPCERTRPAKIDDAPGGETLAAFARPASARSAFSPSGSAWSLRSGLRLPALDACRGSRRLAARARCAPYARRNPRPVSVRSWI